MRVDQVTGVSYQPHSVLDIHQDGPLPLNTMSVALGCACTFVVGGALPKGRENYPNLRTGARVTLRMESGDAVFFDGGSVAHAVPAIHAGSAPPFWEKAARKAGIGDACARISVLFREPDGCNAKYLG